MNSITDTLKCGLQCEESVIEVVTYYECLNPSLSLK